MTNDPIEISIGKFGKYQAWVSFLVLIGRIPSVFQITNVVFILPDVEYICMDDNAQNATNYCPCENPEYDRSMIASSVTTEWNLICDRKYLASLAQSMLHAGMLVGSLFFGYLSDRFGRKVGTITACFTSAVFSTISAIVPDFLMFLVCRLLIGASSAGAMMCCYVLYIELCGKSFRSYMLAIYETGYILGFLMLPIIAYFVRDWRMFQLVVSVPGLLVIVYIWPVVESPRWLMSVGKKTEAIQVLTYIAKKNNRPVECIEHIVNEFEKPTSLQTKKHSSYLDLFRTTRIATLTILAALLWIFCAHIYYGINQYIGRLQGNIYLNVILSGISLIPTVAIVFIITLYFKRKITATTSFFLSGLSLILHVCVPSNMEWLSLTFAIIGLMGAFGSFVQLYLFTSEIFPTVVRNSAMGLSSVFGRLGGLAAPFVVNLETKWLPFLVFGIMSIIAGILCYLLPETKGIVLPNSIEEIHTSPNEKSTTRK